MKQKVTGILVVVMAFFCFICTACGVQTEDAKPAAALQQEANEGLGGDGPSHEDRAHDVSRYEGIWLGDAGNQYDYIQFTGEGYWQLYRNGTVVDKGYLRYEPEYEAIYAYSHIDRSGGRVVLQEGRLYITTMGYFNDGDDMTYYWCGEEDRDAYARQTDGEAIAAKEYYSWNDELCQRNVAEFQGVWYFDGNIAATTYIVIDDNGNWSYYQRAPGTEATEMDYGILTYSTDEVSTYYADSTLYDGVSIRVYEVDRDMLIWGDEGAYYLMEY